MFTAFPPPEVVAPYTLQQVGPGEHLAGMGQQQGQQVKLQLGQRYPLAVEGYAAGFRSRQRARQVYCFRWEDAVGFPARRRTASTRSRTTWREKGLVI